MNIKNKRWQQSTRIIWAILSKDVLEAIKNKTTLTVIISALFIVFMYRAMPFFETINKPVALLVYDGGNSEFIKRLEDSQTVNLYTYPTEEKLRAVILEGEVPEIGLVLPADFEQKVNANETILLETLIVHWVSPKDKDRLVNITRQEIMQLTGRDVQITTETIYMTPESGGINVMAGLGIIFTIVMIGLTLIPHLMLEEKKSKTMDALQVSPAANWELVAAKALVGLFYCMLAAGIGLGIYYRLVLHWWLAVLTLISISIAIIPLGLWLGVRLEDRSQLTILSWVFILPLFFPMIIMLLEPLFPEIIIRISGWFPTSVALQLLRSAFAQPLDLIASFGYILYLLVWAGAGMLLVVWQIRQLDRKEEGLFEIKERKPRSIRMTSETETPGVMPGSLDENPAKHQISPKILDLNKVKTNSSWIIRVLAITNKDLHEAMKNKMILSLIFGTALLILPNAFLPKMIRSEDKPAAVVYDSGGSEIINALSRSGEVRMHIVESEAEFHQSITEALGNPIGLVIPQNFDEKVHNGEEIVIQTAAVHWASEKLLAKWTAFYSEKLSAASHATVKVELPNVSLYPSASASGYPRLVGIIMSLGILTLGLSILPLLVVEEKEAHTLDALLISPANLSQILSGKAMAGMIYTLIVFAVASFAYAHLFNNWVIVCLTALASTFFITSMGLLVGILSNNPSTISLWNGLIILAILAMVGLDSLSNPTWPTWLQMILTWTPGSIMARMMTFSMADKFHITQLALNAAVLVSSGLILFGLVAWLIHTSEQQ